MVCKKCGSEEEYIGEHFSGDEGWCSVYLCKKCYPKLFRKYRQSWLSHLRRCNKERFQCDRCQGKGKEYKLNNQVK